MNLRYLFLLKDIIKRLLPQLLSTACQNTSVIILKTTVIFRREEGIYSINFVQLSLLTIILEGSYSIDFVHPSTCVSVEEALCISWQLPILHREAASCIVLSFCAPTRTASASYARSPESLISYHVARMVLSGFATIFCCAPAFYPHCLSAKKAR